MRRVEALLRDKHGKARARCGKRVVGYSRFGMSLDANWRPLNSDTCDKLMPTLTTTGSSGVWAMFRKVGSKLAVQEGVARASWSEPKLTSSMKTSSMKKALTEREREGEEERASVAREGGKAATPCYRHTAERAHSVSDLTTWLWCYRLACCSELRGRIRRWSPPRSASSQLAVMRLCCLGIKQTGYKCRNME